MTSERTRTPDPDRPRDRTPEEGSPRPPESKHRASGARPASAEAVEEQPADEARTEEAESDGKAEEYLRLAQRAQADLINFRRRVEQERDELRGTSRVEALQTLLPILDDFERAIAAIPEESRSLPWVQGILLIERNLRSVIERAGFERIDAQGKPFDPREHEGVMTDPSGQHEDDTVTAVVRPGYRVGGRVLRPAQVVVARRG
ncbi:MAG TPA: nucleotide exchange factor GrpE [Chloroflexota bacterium]|nr:nucleotide exchange factor GrpE [Chloroflexota bacterium]